MSPLHPDDQALFEAARGQDDPTVDDRARVQRRLARRLGAAAVGLTATSAWTGGAVAAFGSSVAKTLAAVVVLAGVSVGGAAIYRSAVAPTPTHAPGRAPAVLTAPSVLEPLATAQPAVVVAAPAADPIPPPAPSSPSADLPPPPVASSVARSPVSAARGPVPASPSSSLQGELASLARADAALRDGQGARALALLDEHERRFPQSVLGEERAVERILALCAAGHDSEARSAADAFTQANPSSPYASRLRASCVRGRASVGH